MNKLFKSIALFSVLGVGYSYIPTADAFCVTKCNGYSCWKKCGYYYGHRPYYRHVNYYRHGYCGNYGCSYYRHW